MNIIVYVVTTLARQAVVIFFAHFTSLVKRTATLAFIHLDIVLGQATQTVILRVASFAMILGSCASGAFSILEEK